MSKAIVCDQCGETLIVNDRGDADNGEEAAWLRIVTSLDTYHACSRACAAALLDDEQFAARMDEQLEIITEIARAITGDNDEPGDDE